MGGQFVLQAREKIDLLKVVCRDVDADGKVEALIVPGSQLRQRGIDDPVTDADGQIAPFDQRQEFDGGSNPRSGCCQRISASAPMTAPVRMLTFGW